MFNSFARDFAAPTRFFRDRIGHPLKEHFDARMKQKESNRANIELTRVLKVIKMNTKNMPEPT